MSAGTTVKGIAVPDRRRQPRTPARIALGLLVGDQVTICSSRDFSEGGVFIEARLAVAAGTPVHILMTPPGASQAIRLEGQVTRVVAEGVAVEFGPLRDDARQGVNRFLESASAQAGSTRTPVRSTLPDEFDANAIRAAIERESQDHVAKTAIARQIHQSAQRALDEGRVDAAVSLLEAAVQLAPGEADLHRDLGLAYYANNDVPKAVKAFERALQLEPESS